MTVKKRDLFFVFCFCFLLPILVASCSKDENNNLLVPDDYIPQGKELVQCKGVTIKGARCKIMTLNADGYCNYHRDQAADDSGVGNVPDDGSPNIVQCKGITTKGERCKKTTKNPDGYCNYHRDQAPTE